MTDGEESILGAERTQRLIAEMAEKIWEGRRQDRAFCLVGVRSRGVPLAQRLAQELKTYAKEDVPVGAVEITLYRDDLDQGRRWPVLLGTEIPFDVDGTEIVLVDDVLFTGRTIRAALNTICDLGRPGRIRLAVLVDRGHRELPIQPDVVGLRLETERGDRVRVRLRPLDATEDIVRIVAAPRDPASHRSPAS